MLSNLYYSGIDNASATNRDRDILLRDREETRDASVRDQDETFVHLETKTSRPRPHTCKNVLMLGQLGQTKKLFKFQVCSCKTHLGRGYRSV